MASNILAFAISIAIIASTVALICYSQVHQRQDFILRCLAELGNNNIELCSSIAK